MNTIISQRWYQEPWVWFNLVLLSVAIIAASAMSVIAVQHTPAEIGSRWYQEGVLAKRERQQAVLIHELHLRGELAIAKSGTLTLSLQQAAQSSDQETLKAIDVPTLLLYVEHPTNPALDQTITLKRVQSNQYTGHIQGELAGKHRLLISPESDIWYLTGKAYFPTDSVSFQADMS